MTVEIRLRTPDFRLQDQEKSNGSVVMAKEKGLALIRHTDFKCFYAIGAVSAWTPHDFRINFYSEKVNDKEGEALVNDVQIILPPKAVRELAVALTRNIKEYERTHGVSLKDLDKGLPIEVQAEALSVSAKSKTDPEDILSPAFKKDLKKDLKQDLKKDLKQDLKRDLKQDLKRDLEKGIKQDIKKDLEKDLKQDLKKDIQTEVRGAVKGTALKDQRSSGVKGSTTKIPQRGRRKVGKGRKAVSK